MYKVHRITPSQVVFNCLAERDTLAEALALAERMHDPLKRGVTITVECEGSKVPCASLSTKRIIGKMVKQVWVGDHAVACGIDNFDATGHILSLSLGQIHNLKDHGNTTGDVGQAHVTWKGPHEVDIVDSVCEYFGVCKLTDITEHHISYVKMMAQVHAQCQIAAPEAPVAAGAPAVRTPAQRGRLAAFMRAIVDIDVEKVIADNAAAARLRDIVLQSRAVMETITSRHVQPLLENDEREDETDVPVSH